MPNIIIPISKSNISIQLFSIKTSRLESKIVAFSWTESDSTETFPIKSSRIRVFQQIGAPERVWLQEESGERWIWISQEEISKTEWIKGKPIHYLEGKTGSWIQFEKGEGPPIESGVVVWYSGEKRGKTWYFQQGETRVYARRIPNANLLDGKGGMPRKGRFFLSFSQGGFFQDNLNDDSQLYLPIAFPVPFHTCTFYHW